MKVSLNLLSNSQAKLEVIMSKMVDILPFIHEDCERVFHTLSSVAQATLDQRLTAATAATFSNMTLFEL
jgi:hypothetical protein